MKKYSAYRKREVPRDYFLVPNDVFVLKLTPGEFMVYGYLLRCENRETFDCYPSMKTISRATGLSMNSVRKYVEGLRDKCLIRTEQTRVQMQGGGTRNGNLRFQIRPIEEAVQDFYDRELLGIG